MIQTKKANAVPGKIGATSKPVYKTLSVNLRDDLHHRGVIYAAKERRPWKDVLNEALEEYLKKRGA